MLLPTRRLLGIRPRVSRVHPRMRWTEMRAQHPPRGPGPWPSASKLGTFECSFYQRNFLCSQSMWLVDLEGEKKWGKWNGFFLFLEAKVEGGVKKKIVFIKEFEVFSTRVNYVELCCLGCWFNWNKYIGRVIFGYGDIVFFVSIIVHCLY